MQLILSTPEWKINPMGAATGSKLNVYAAITRDTR